MRRIESIDAPDQHKSLKVNSAFHECQDLSDIYFLRISWFSLKNFPGSITLVSIKPLVRILAIPYTF